MATPKLRPLFRILLILALVAINISCDQVSKSVVRKNIEYSETIEVIGSNLILTKTENRGAMLGLGSSLPPVWRKIFLLGVPALFMLIILGITFFKTNLSYLAVVGLTFIVGGGIGNLIDRIAYGSVTDFLHIDLNLVRTGIFNMADVSVMVGTGLMLIFLFKKEKPPA